MHGLVLLAVLLSGVPEVETGALLFLQNADKIVDKYTGSEIDHVAMIVHIHGQPWVYEATPPQVRRLALKPYCEEILRQNQRKRESIRIWLMRPKDAYTAEQVAIMRTYLDSQLGRRYSIRNYVRDKEGDGIHCAELTAKMLTRTGKMRFAKCHAENPSSLMQKVRPTYTTRVEIVVQPQPTTTSWCSRTWEWWKKAFRWCGWSCRETWTFCR